MDSNSPWIFMGHAVRLGYSVRMLRMLMPLSLIVVSFVRLDYVRSYSIIFSDFFSIVHRLRWYSLEAPTEGSWTAPSTFLATIYHWHVDSKHKFYTFRTINDMAIFQSLSFGRPFTMSFDYIDPLLPRKAVDADSESGNDMSCMCIFITISFW
jgi:hypothetical protein